MERSRLGSTTLRVLAATEGKGIDGILRAAPLWTVMSRLGRVFASNEGTAADFELSQPTESIEAFVSHSWKSSRVLKAVALLRLYTLDWAIAAAFVASLVVCIATSFGVFRPIAYVRVFEDVDEAVPLGMWSSCACAFVLALAPTVVSAARRFLDAVGLAKAPRLFLDKVCIHQTKQQLKQQGIESLGGFLHASRDFLLLWDGFYFQRLWCVLELAAFHRVCLVQQERLLSLGIPTARRRLILVPIALSLVETIGCAVTFSVAALGYGADLIAGSGLIMRLATAFVICAPLLAATPSMRSYIKDRKLLDEQIANFRVADAECLSAADRELIHGLIAVWYSRQQMGSVSPARLKQAIAVGVASAQASRQQTGSASPARPKQTVAVGAIPSTPLRRPSAAGTSQASPPRQDAASLSLEPTPPSPTRTDPADAQRWQPRAALDPPAEACSAAAGSEAPSAAAGGSGGGCAALAGDGGCGEGSGARWAHTDAARRLRTAQIAPTPAARASGLERSRGGCGGGSGWGSEWSARGRYESSEWSARGRCASSELNARGRCGSSEWSARGRQDDSSWAGRGPRPEEWSDDGVANFEEVVRTTVRTYVKDIGASSDALSFTRCLPSCVVFLAMLLDYLSARAQLPAALHGGWRGKAADLSRTFVYFCCFAFGAIPVGWAALFLMASRVPPMPTASRQLAVDLLVTGLAIVPPACLYLSIYALQYRIRVPGLPRWVLTLCVLVLTASVVFAFFVRER